MEKEGKAMGIPVVTLALGSRLRQKGITRVRAKGKPESKPRGSPGVKPRGSPGVKAKGSPRVTSHTPGSARKC
jgi:hypothetical protein